MKTLMLVIKRMLTNNWMLKLLALLIASIVWLAVINVNDPTKTVTIYNIPVNLLNEEIITDNNQIFEVVGNKTVNVTVTGRRSVVSSLGASNFIASASMEELSLTNSIPVTVALKNSNIAGKVTISKQSITQLSVNIENIVTKSYVIEQNVSGEVAKNYELNEVKLVKNVVEITAPESAHERIAKVAVNVNLDGVSANYTDKYKVVLYDAAGNRIAKDDTITLSNNKIQVSVTVLKLIKVPIVVETTGNLTDGYELISAATELEEVVIAGAASIVDKITELKISGEVADITGLTSTVEREVNLVDYLTAGTYIRGTADTTLTLVVEGDITKIFTFKPDEIKIEDIGDDLKAEILSEEIEVTLSGKERHLKDIEKDSLKPLISLKGLEPGKSNVELTIAIPEETVIVGSDDVKVKITKKE